ncbi:hypothetical protein HLB03_11685, partial [Acidianus sp. DSM 29099]|nr:hypothetical protein [Acidianus sp. RZ1]
MLYISVITGNYIKPIFISQTLKGTAQTLSYSEGIYALAGISIGILTPYLIKIKEAFSIAVLMAVIYCIGSLLMPLSAVS